MLGTVIVAVSLALARLAEGMDDRLGRLARVGDPRAEHRRHQPGQRASRGGLDAADEESGRWLDLHSRANHDRDFRDRDDCGAEQRINLREVFALSVVVAGFAAALTAAALAARAAGFRLAIGNVP